MQCLLLTIVVWLITASACLANNSYFLPGDAFFHATLTEKMLQELEAQEAPYTLSYSLENTYAGAFCGYAGYETAQVPAIDERFVANLKWTYEKFRGHRKFQERLEGDAPALDEIDGMHLFLYRDDFDLEDTRHQLALQYNENWMKEAQRFVPYVRLCSFIDTAEAIEANWRDSHQVPGLDVQLPKVELTQGQAVTEPIVIRGKVKAIVFPTRPLVQYFQREDYLPLYVVTSEGVTEYTADDGKWTQVETHRPAPMPKQ